MQGKPGTQYELEVQWRFGEQGHITAGQLTLINHGNHSPRQFQLCLSGVVRVNDTTEISGARLVEYLSNYLVLAPLTDSQWSAEQNWIITLGEPAYPMRHYTEGFSAAYLYLDDGTTVDVALKKTTALDGTTEYKSRDLANNQTPPLAKSTDATQPDTNKPVWQITPYPNHVSLAGAATDARGLSFIAEHDSAQLAVDRFTSLCACLYPDDQWYDGDLATGIEVRFKTHEGYQAEQYRIEFDDGCVTVFASEVSAYFYALISLGQLMRSSINTAALFPVSGVIEDQPAMQWRGCHLDVARQFYSVDSIKRFLCILAWNKLNRFHWHLSDDEAWRIEIQAYPELTQTASWRGHGHCIPPVLGSGAARSGGYYTRSQVTQIVQFAKQLGIVVIPELDMPGHCFAAIKGVPQLADPGEPVSYRSLQGFPNNCLNPVLPQTYEFVETVIDELAPLFPDKYWHVGADEVPESAWHASPSVIQSAGDTAATASDLQARFLKKVHSQLKHRGFVTGAWQEGALNDGISTDQSYLVAWLDTSAAKQLAAKGYNVVVSAGQAYYLDMAMGDTWSEPGLGWAGSVSLQQSYEFNPTEGWDNQLVSRCMGIQACIWSEQMTNQHVFDYLVFPRLSAVAETAWTHNQNKNWQRFEKNVSVMPRLYQR